MVLAFGLDHIIISADRPKDPAASRYLENTASTRGKASITVEAGHAGTVETDDYPGVRITVFNNAESGMSDDDVPAPNNQPDTGLNDTRAVDILTAEHWSLLSA